VLPLLTPKILRLREQASKVPRVFILGTNMEVFVRFPLPSLYFLRKGQQINLI
jgi:hypothetical protein